MLYGLFVLGSRGLWEFEGYFSEYPTPERLEKALRLAEPGLFESGYTPKEGADYYVMQIREFE
jgi:hypothetical protein